MLTRRAVLRLAALATLSRARPAAAQAHGRRRVEEGRRGRQEGGQGRRLQRRGRHAGPAEGRAPPSRRSTASASSSLEARASELRERIRTEQAAGKVLGDVSHNGSTTTALQLAEGTFQPYGALPNARPTDRALQGGRHPGADLRDPLRDPRQHRHGEARRGAEELEGHPGPAVEGQDPERRHARAGRRRGLLHGHHAALRPGVPGEAGRAAAPHEPRPARKLSAHRARRVSALRPVHACPTSSS